MADSVKVAKKRRSLGNVFKKNKNKEEDSVLAEKSQQESSDESEKENSDCDQVVVVPTSNVDNSEIIKESQSDTLEKKKKKSSFRPRLSFSKKKKKAPKELNPEVKRALESIIKENFFVEVEDETNDENSEATQPKPEEENSGEETEERPEADNDEQGEDTIAVSRENESEEESITPEGTTEHSSSTENNTAGKELAVLTADQMYSTLMGLLSDLLLKAGQSPRQVVMYVLSYLVKKYPHCFNIKAMRAGKSDRVAEQDAAK